MTPTQRTIIEIIIPLATLIYIVALTVFFVLRNNAQLAREFERERQETPGPAGQTGTEQQRTISTDVQRSAPRPAPSRTLNGPPIPRQRERSNDDTSRYEEPPTHGLPA